MNTIFCIHTQSETSHQKDQQANWTKWGLCRKSLLFLESDTFPMAESLDAHARNLPYFTIPWSTPLISRKYYTTLFHHNCKISSKTHSEVQRHSNFDKDITSMVISIYQQGNTVWRCKCCTHEWDSTKLVASATSERQAS